MAQTTIFEILYNLRDNASKQFQQASQKIDSSAQKTTQSVNTSQMAFERLGNAIKTFVALAAVREVVMFLKSSAYEAAQAERSFNQLALAYENTGRAFNAFDIKKFATDMQALTAAEDDSVIATMALLSNMTDLNDKGIKEATKLAIGLSKVYGEDLMGTAQTLAQYLNTGMTRAVRRFGISVSEDLNNPVDRLNDLLDEQTRFLKQAQDLSNDSIGINQQLANSWQNLKESLGGQLNPALNNTKQLLTDIMDKMTQLVNMIPKQLPGMGMLGSAGKGFGGGGGGGWGGNRPIPSKPITPATSGISLIKNAEIENDKVVEKATANIKKLEEAFKKVRTQSEHFSKAYVETRESMRGFIAQFPELIQGYDAYTESLNKYNDSLDTNIQLIEDLKKVSTGLETLPTYPPPNIDPGHMQAAQSWAGFLTQYADSQHPSAKMGKAIKGVWDMFKGKSDTEELKPNIALDIANLSMQFATAISNAFNSSQVQSSMSKVGTVMQATGQTLQGLSTMTTSLGASAAGLGPWGMGLSLVGGLIGMFGGGGNRLPTPTRPVDVRLVEITGQAATTMLGITERRLIASTAEINRSVDFRSDLRVME